MKKGKSVLLTLLVGGIALTSCNKENQLANKLEDKWTIDSLEENATTVVEWFGTDGLSDSVKTNPNANANVTVSSVVTGTVDFVSEDNIIMETKTVTTTTTKKSDGSSTTVTAESEGKMSAEYFATGEEEVTVVDAFGGYTTYKVLTNEKDKQVWESTEVDVNESSSNFPKTITTVTTVSTLSITKIEE